MARDLRYALPRQLERWALGPEPTKAAQIAKQLQADGIHATFGYFQANGDDAAAITTANLAMASQMAALSDLSYLSVKAPPLHFDADRMHAIAAAAHASKRAVLFDAHAPGDATKTLALLHALLPEFPQTGCVLPARWQRSVADADRLASTTARIRIVKGEWPDGAGPDGDLKAQYLALVQRLAGRAAPVAIATHDLELAHAALSILIASGTPCELEQLRGLPRQRTTAVATALQLPVRVYVPFGDGWWPYAVDKALSRPYLPLWFAKDVGHGRRGTRLSHGPDLPENGPS